MQLSVNLSFATVTFEYNIYVRMSVNELTACMSERMHEYIRTYVHVFLYTYVIQLQFSQWLYVALPLILEHTYWDVTLSVQEIHPDKSAGHIQVIVLQDSTFAASEVLSSSTIPGTYLKA